MNPHPVCRDGVDLLIDYLEGTLPDADRALIEEHVASCPRCLAFVESYRRTPEILRRATLAELPDDLATSLRRFLASRR